jgi:hypothetical protein
MPNVIVVAEPKSVGIAFRLVAPPIAEAAASLRDISNAAARATICRP